MAFARFISLWLTVLFVPIPDVFSKVDIADRAGRSKDFTLFEENGKVGLKDGEGHILIPASYDAIGWSNGELSVIEKVVGYQLNGQWGLIHTSNKVITPAEFLNLKPGEGTLLVAHKKSPVSQRPSAGVVTTSGKTVIPFIYDGLELSNMRAIVMSRAGTRYLFGLTDLSHKILIPIQYKSIHSLGSLRYAVENFESKTAIFSEEGVQVSGFHIDSISAFKKNYAILYQEQKQGLIDRNGLTVLKPVYGEVRIGEDGVVRFRETDEWFFLNGDNKLLRQFRADDLRPLSSTRYAVVTGGKLQLTDNDFNPLHEGYFSSLGTFVRGMALYRKASRTGVISDGGKILLPSQYLDLAIERDGFRACLDNGAKNRWVLLDGSGKQLSQKNYEFIAPFNGKYYPIKNRGYWGALNSKGEEIISCVHDSLIQESHDNIVVKFRGQYGVINVRENWVVPPQSRPLKLLDDQTYFEYADSTTFVRSFRSGIIYFSNNLLTYRDGHIREDLPTGGYWILDMNGIVTERSNQPLNAERVFAETEGLRPILKDGKYGFIDNVGRLRIANRYEDVKPFSGGFAAIRIRGKWGFIDRAERLVVQPIYDEVENFNDGVAIVKQGIHEGLIDGTGKLRLPLRYQEIRRNEHDRLILRQDNMYGMADASGALLINPRYNEIQDPGNGYIIIKRDGKYGAVTLRGVNTIPMIYDALSFDSFRGHFLARKNSPWQTLQGLK